MAYRLLRVCNTLAKVQPTIYRPAVFTNGAVQHNLTLVNQQQILTNIVRNSTFFNKYSAERLWKACTSVSNAGRKRGRARSRMQIKNLNRGQIIGVGKINMVWPGLNAPVIQGREIVKQQELPPDPEREKRIYQLRNISTRRRNIKVHPLERGWTSAKPTGRKIGAPDPIGDEKFENFETIIIEYKQVAVMTGNLGRKRRISALVVTGNRNGLAGFGLGKAPEGKAALRKGKNRGGQRLMYIKRCDERTLYHDFFAQFGSTKVYAFKKPEGRGLRCQRIIKACCEVIGIKDLSAKIEGPKNPQHIVKAFFLGLLQQKTYEEMAEEKKLHLVEFRPERDNFPIVVASPQEVRKKEDIKLGEVLDFKQYAMGGRIVQENPKRPPFYEALPSWITRLRKIAYLRNKDEVRIRILAEHGEYRSFLTDKFPEAKPVRWSKNRKQKDAEQ